MRYLVTGGAGFIGSHLVEALIEDGHHVVSVDNFSSGLKSNLPVHKNLKSLAMDITHDFPSNIGPFHGIFHLAADARIQPTIKDPRDAINNNIIGTAKILELARKKGISKIVYSASSSTYGLANKSPLKETMTPNCLTPYAVSKLTGELLCSTWGNCYGLRTVSLKYFNVYGERTPTHIGAYSPVIGLFFKQALNGEPITVVGDGQQRRDFTHVHDVVRANILAMNEMDRSPKICGETINIGTGDNYTINRLATKIASICSQFVPFPAITHVEARPSESRETLADISKAKDLLNWEPTITLDAGLKSLVYYYLDPLIFIQTKAEA